MSENKMHGQIQIADEVVGVAATTVKVSQNSLAKKATQNA